AARPGPHPLDGSMVTRGGQCPSFGQVYERIFELPTPGRLPVRQTSASPAGGAQPFETSHATSNVKFLMWITPGQWHVKWPGDCMTSSNVPLLNLSEGAVSRATFLPEAASR